MEFIAVQKFIRTSPRKLRVVVGMVKSLPPARVLEELPFSGKKSAEPLLKVIATALANAKQQGVDGSTLEIKEIQIGEGPRMKRWRPGARGRAKPYKRPMSHIRVVLKTVDSEKTVAVKPAKKSEKSGEVSKKTVEKRKTAKPAARVKKGGADSSR